MLKTEVSVNIAAQTSSNSVTVTVDPSNNHQPSFFSVPMESNYASALLTDEKHTVCLG